jgi:hypothetical protein
MSVIPEMAGKFSEPEIAMYKENIRPTLSKATKSTAAMS